MVHGVETWIWDLVSARIEGSGLKLGKLGNHTEFFMVSVVMFSLSRSTTSHLC